MSYANLQRAAACRVSAALARPIPDAPEWETLDDFNPWDLFPALLGCHGPQLEQCAIDVLCDVRDTVRRRDDLAAAMFHEILCTAGLCEYDLDTLTGIATTEFKPLLPRLIEAWKAYARMKWGADFEESTA